MTLDAEGPAIVLEITRMRGVDVYRSVLAQLRRACDARNAPRRTRCLESLVALWATMPRDLRRRAWIISCERHTQRWD